jgi:hypothetical protein
MKEHGVLFNHAMARALVLGLKTQTRRPYYVRAKCRSTSRISTVYPPPEVRTTAAGWPDIAVGECWQLSRWADFKVGERMWGRETFRESSPDQDGNTIEYRADRPEYQKRDDDPSSIPWTPSIHMPRRAARFLLDITETRVERLWDISAEDCVREGISIPATDCFPEVNRRSKLRERYFKLWESINGTFQDNPWVAVITFKPVTP